MELGVPIVCRIGECKVCKIKILKGAENLEAPTEHEQGLEKDERLGCQCKIKSGEVEIDF